MFSSFLATRGSSQGQREENRQALQAVQYENLERPPAHFFTPQAAQNWDNWYQTLAGVWAGATHRCWYHVTGPILWRASQGS